MPNAIPSLDTIVCEAVEIGDAPARAAYLDRACGNDAALRQRAHALVAAHFRAGSFLDRPVDQPAETAAYNPDPGSPLPEVGTVIGPYHLRELIGEGGMGLVFVAEQTQPVRRKVALKLIKPGMDSRQVIGRFEAERQALALMDHPNIAKVFDGGTTPDGRPYFVMELVKGEPLTEYCDRNKLSLRQRLELFLQVCHAVQHAHQKGIIHRDLKPSNVLVAVHDVTPVVKVIDFGIAKAMGQQLTDKTVYTALAQFVGTPLYMSPEQAGQSSLDVDTRTDVYALGVMLYELLTGSTPFDPETFRAAGFAEVCRIIREVEPARPSARVSTLDAAARSTVSARRGLGDRQLGPSLRGDLDWVVMKALEKDRNRRYESAGAFAADIERFLRHEPVLARAPSATYRLRKFARRNRAVLATVAVLSVAVLTAAGSLGWGLRDAAARRWVAEQAATNALAESADHYRADRPEAAMAAAERAVDTLAGVPGAEQASAEAKQRVADLEMAARLEDAWLDGMDASRSYGAEAQAAEAHANFRAYGLDATELSEAELVERIRPKLIALELVAGLDGWAIHRRTSGGPADPLAVKLRAVSDTADPDKWSCRVRDVTLDGTADQMAALAAEIPVDVASQTAVVRLALTLKKVGRVAETEALLRRTAYAHPNHVRPAFSLADLLRLSPSEPTRMEALGFYRVALALRPRSLAVRLRIGVCLTDHLGRPAEGAEVFRELIRLRPSYTLARMNLAVALRKQGKQAEAVAAAREAVAITPGIITYQSLGNELDRFGQRNEAEEAFRAVLRFEPQSSAQEHFARGNALSRLGQRDEAIVAYREAVRLNPENIYALLNLGNELTKAGAVDEGLALYRQALQHKPGYALAHNGIAIQLRRRGQVKEAVTAYREAVRSEPDNAEYRHNLSLGLDQLGQWEEAVKELKEATRLKPENAESHYALGLILNKAERIDEAIAAYKQAIHHKPGYAEAHCNLAHIYRRREQYNDALVHYQKGHEAGTKDPKWPYPSDKWLDDCRRMMVLEPRLTAILAGTDIPTDAVDTALAASVAAEKKRYVRAAELYRAAFTQAPALADDVKVGKRYFAACSAARAGCGLGEDAANLATAEREKWRRQALAWLRADLSVWEKQAVGTAASRHDVQNKLTHWQTDRDLASVRAAAELAKLPDAERAEWQKFWADVQAALVKSRAPAAKAN